MLALDQLGVDVDDAEFEVLEEPRPGMFGRVRVRPCPRPCPPERARTKTERRTPASGRQGQRRGVSSDVASEWRLTTLPPPRLRCGLIGIPGGSGPRSDDRADATVRAEQRS